MIGWLQGRIIDKSQPGRIVLAVQGIGYEIDTSLATFFQIEHQESDVSLHIQTIVREDAFLLYGFTSLEERALFRALIKVSGIGPRLAMGILSSISPGEFIQLILQADLDLLTKLPGIGKKTAQRLTIEMKDAVEKMSTDNLAMTNANKNPNAREATQALEALGYKAIEVSKIINVLDIDLTCEQLIRQALQLLSKRR